MAEIILKTGDSINATATYMIQGDSTGQMSVVTIQITKSAWSGSIVVKGRKTGSTLTALGIPYKKRWLNGAAGDDTNVTTAITDVSLIEVEAAGLDVALDNTHTSGAAVVNYSWSNG